MPGRISPRLSSPHPSGFFLWELHLYPQQQLLLLVEDVVKEQRRRRWTWRPTLVAVAHDQRVWWVRRHW